MIKKFIVLIISLFGIMLSSNTFAGDIYVLGTLPGPDYNCTSDPMWGTWCSNTYGILRKYDIDTLILKAEVLNFQGSGEKIFSDGIYIYIKSGYTITIYNKDTFNLIATHNLGFYIENIVFDGNYVYASGGPTIKKYNKSDFTFIGETPICGNSTQGLVIDGNYIYITEYSSPGNGLVKKYNKSDLSFVANGPIYGTWQGGSYSALYIDGDYIYAGGRMFGGGGGTAFQKINKNTMLLEGMSTYDWHDIYDIKSDLNYIYVFGNRNDGFLRYDKTTLTVVDGSAQLGNHRGVGEIEDLYIDTNFIYSAGKYGVIKHSKTDLVSIASNNDFVEPWNRAMTRGAFSIYVPGGTTTSPAGDSNGNYTHYILNRLTATEGNMQQANNSAGSTAFSNGSQVKSNFLANYNYMQSWYESKGLTLDVINNNVDWNNGGTFGKTDVAGGMLDGFKLSAHYPFASYRETDNTDSSVFWRTDLSNTSFQTDTTWTNVGIPAYPIRNSSNNIVAYLEFPCGNLICKDQYCSDIKKIINPNLLNPIPETHIGVDVLNPTAPYCGDTIKNTMDEECDGNDGIRHDQSETCNAQCKIETSPGIAPGCPTFSALGYVCNPTAQPIFSTNTNPTPPGGNTNSTNTGSVINWTPPGSITLPVIGDINTNTGMTDTEETISNDVVCSSIDEGFKNSKSIIVTNTMADTSFLTGLKGKTEFIKTLSGSSTEVAEKIIQKKLKAEKLNIKSSTYDLGTKGTVSGIQFNLSKIPNSAVMRKLVNLAIDHSSTTMADYEQTVKDSCNGTITSTGTMVVPAGFIDVNEKGETVLNLFRFNGE